MLESPGGAKHTYLRPRAGIKYACFYQSYIRDASETQETMQP
jgi:hypothetical protein